MNPYTLRKTLRALEIARRNRLPVINLVESGGADLPTQSDLFVGAGKIFHDLTELSAAGVPTVALVFGNSTAGGAYVPGMCDYAVLVDQQAKVFLGGPPLVKMATGERCRRGVARRGRHALAGLRGGRLLRRRRAGLPSASAARSWPTCNWRKLGPRPRGRGRGAPLYDPDELLGIVSPDFRVPFDPREVIARVERRLALQRVQVPLRHQPGHRVDLRPRLPGRRPGQRARRAVQRGGQEGGRVHPAGQRERHPADLPAEHHRVHGRHPVRAGRHHQGRRQDDQRRDELGRPAHHRQRGRLVRSRQLRHVRARLRPAADVRLGQRQAGRDGSPAAGRGAVDRRQGLRRRHRARVRRGGRRQRRQQIEEQIERESHSFFVSARLYDDGVIDPRDTRSVLGMALSAAHSGPVEGRRGFGVFRM